MFFQTLQRNHFNQYIYNKNRNAKEGIRDCIAKRYREINMKHSSKRRHMDTPQEDSYVFLFFADYM